MKQQILSVLAKTDLREDEIQVYLAALKLQQASLRELCTATGISHTTTYRTINRLIERGLLQKVPINNKQSIFKALPLSNLIISLESEQRRLRKLELALKNLDHLLPYLDSEDSEVSSDDIQILTGHDAFCEEYLKLPELKADEFLAIGSSDNFWQAAEASIDSPLERSFVSRRLKHNVYSRSMMVATDDAEKIASNDSREKRTTKLKQSLPVMSNMLMMSGDQVSHFICDTENPHVITIRHPELVAMQKQYFETLWNS